MLLSMAVDLKIEADTYSHPRSLEENASVDQVWF